uniref:BHLH domain-containing protein n=1 Tax=Mycena chlorophos TaxID=658473 RepID=A0ABQ0KZ75_MYCCL|nr:predicted protein [Mycena chlorophos]
MVDDNTPELGERLLSFDDTDLNFSFCNTIVSTDNQSLVVTLTPPSTNSVTLGLSYEPCSLPASLYDSIYRPCAYPLPQDASFSPSVAPCPELLPSSPTSSDATTSSFPPSPLLSPGEYLPPSPLSSDFEDDGLGLGFLSDDPSWPRSSPKLLTFGSFPWPELDDLDIEMDMPGTLPSPSRRSVSSLPSLFDEGEIPELVAEAVEDSPLVSNALCLDVLESPPSKRFSILDSFTPAELSARNSKLPQDQLDSLLAVRSRAQATLAECAALPPSECPPTILGHELRRSVPRDAGEPRRRRKRAKELHKEIEALIGLALAILPDSATRECHQHQVDDVRQCVRRDKAGLGDLTDISQLVARMVLRRRERCVRGFDSAGPPRCYTASPLSADDGSA